MYLQSLTAISLLLSCGVSQKTMHTYCLVKCCSHVVLYSCSPVLCLPGKVLLLSVCLFVCLFVCLSVSSCEHVLLSAGLLVKYPAQGVT